ncbi:PKD domain-containing protein [Halonatronum saccharophilum]|uniref:PKD domain-containing protein n=1 Tax=Halonatronum saccharophilum TaxID=150060 RepID=UPI000488F8EE|nr:PKD domain-containing protein [Halonatronum saccharophilum]
MFKSTKAYIFMVLLIFLFLSGCNESLVIKDFRVDSPFYLRSGHFLGNSEVSFEVELSDYYNGELDYYWSSDGGDFITQGESEVIYLTPQEPGDYTINLLVSNRRGDEVSYEFSFSVIGNPPDSVILKEVATTSLDSGVELEWSEYKGEGFYSYMIFRSENRYIDESTVVVGEVKESQEPYFIDKEIEEEKFYTYQIMVINEQGYFSLSNQKTLYTLLEGVKRTPVGDRIVDLVIDSQGKKIYLVNEKEELLILNTEEQDLIDKISLGFNVDRLFLGDDYLVLAQGGSESIRVLDISTDNIIEYNFGDSIKDIDFREGNIYVLLDNLDSLLKFNVSKWAIDRKWEFKEGESRLIGEKIKALGEDYLIVDPYLGEPLVYKFDDINDPIYKLDMQFIDIIKEWSFDKGSYLLLTNESPFGINLFELNSKELKPKGVFNGNIYPSDFLLVKDKGIVLVAYEDKQFKVFSLDDYKLKDRFYFNKYIHQIIFDDQGGIVYLLASRNDFLEYNLLAFDLEILLGE